MKKQLPDRFRGYSQWLPEDWYIVVLMDKDQEECHQLKAELEEIACQSRLLTKSTVGPGDRFQVMNRLAIEELGAWFLE